MYIIYNNFSKFCFLSPYGSRAVESKINFCEDLLPYVYICCQCVIISFSFWKKLVANIIPLGCSFVFIFTSCISCKTNNQPFHTNNIIIAKLKNCCCFFNQYPVEIQNTLQVLPDKSVLLAQIGTPLLINICWLQ